MKSVSSEILPLQRALRQATEILRQTEVAGLLWGGQCWHVVHRLLVSFGNDKLEKGVEFEVASLELKISTCRSSFVGPAQTTQQDVVEELLRDVETAVLHLGDEVMVPRVESHGRVELGRVNLHEFPD